MSYVAHIIERFGGIRPMACALGKPVSTVQSWKVRGSIPDQTKPEVLAKACEMNLDLRPEDFFPRSQATQAPGDAA